MKKKLVITLSILVLLILGILAYFKWWGGDSFDAWDFIPKSTSAVIKVHLMDDISSAKSTKIWNTLKSTTGGAHLEEKLHFLDSVNGKKSFSTLFQGSSVLLSLHKTSKTNFDFLFILKIKEFSQSAFMSGMVGKFKKMGYTFRSRQYKGFKINDVTKGDEAFSYVFYKNFLLLSYTPFLIEDAIRNTEEKDNHAIKKQFIEAKYWNNQSKQFLFFVNYKKLSEVASGFLKEKIDFPILAGMYETKIDSNFISASGFSYVKNGWLATHTTNPSSFKMAEVIPQNTALLYHITSSDFMDWSQKQAKYLEKNSSKATKFAHLLETKYEINSKDIFGLVDDEIGLATLESPRLTETKKMMFLKSKNIRDAMKYFNELSDRISIQNGDASISEAYSENEIRFFPVSRFPELIFGENGEDFEQCFYINHKEYIIFANDLPELKQLISAIQNEETWGKSLVTNKFLKKTNQSANVSIFVSLPRAWGILQQNITSDWRKHFKENSFAYQSVEYMSFQFSFIENKYYTNFTFSQPTITQKKNITKHTKNGIIFENHLITKPHLLKTHASSGFDILVQDSLLNIHYMNQSGDLMWKKQLEEKISSTIFPIDYYKNGKYQYVFATETKIHLLDRNGNYLDGFPKTLPENKVIDHFNVIDYDLSKRYRFGITDDTGNIFLTDKNCTPLNGWNPLKRNRASITPLRHERIGTNDVMIFIQENGEINVLNRRGQPKSGFPFKTNKKLSTQHLFKPSNSLSNSTITVISTDGELIEVSLTGKVLNRNQLIKPTQTTTFELIADKREADFIIVRKDNDFIEILDNSGNLLFSQNEISAQAIYQYYRFGAAAKNLVVISDPQTNTLKLFDKNGREFAQNYNLKSANEVGVIFSQNGGLTIFSTVSQLLDNYKMNY